MQASLCSHKDCINNLTAAGQKPKGIFTAVNNRMEHLLASKMLFLRFTFG